MHFILFTALPKSPSASDRQSVGEFLCLSPEFLAICRPSSLQLCPLDRPAGSGKEEESAAATNVTVAHVPSHVFLQETL